MVLNCDDSKPIYVQIAEWLEYEILSGNIKENDRIYSQYQLADMFNINPATAAKGLNILADENIVYKKRGLGMYVALDSKKAILDKRKNLTLARLIRQLIEESHRLNIQETELISAIKNEMRNYKGSEENNGY